MSELIWAFSQVEGCRYSPVDTAAQGTHTDTCCDLLKLVTSGSKLSVSSCLLRNFMQLRPILSLRNRIKDIHLKIGHRIKSQGELQADRTRPKWVRYLETCVFSPSQWLPFPQVMTRLKSFAQQPSRQMEISVTLHVSELHSPNCKRSPPLPLWGHPEYIRTGHDTNRPYQILPAWMCLCSTELCCSSGPPSALNFSPEVETASGCCTKGNFLLGDRDGKWSSPAFETCTDSGTNAHFISPWKITSHSLKCETAVSCSSKDK